MIIGSTKEDTTIEKRVALTPETAKNIINLGLKIYIEIKLLILYYIKFYWDIYMFLKQ